MILPSVTHSYSGVWTAHRCVLLVFPLRRKSDLESPVAPYKVSMLATEDQASIEALPLKDVHLENLHVVCHDAVSWWWNPYVIHFLREVFLAFSLFPLRGLAT